MKKLLLISLTLLSMLSYGQQMKFFTSKFNSTGLNGFMGQTIKVDGSKVYIGTSVGVAVYDGTTSAWSKIDGSTTGALALNDTVYSIDVKGDTISLGTRGKIFLKIPTDTWGFGKIINGTAYDINLDDTYRQLTQYAVTDNGLNIITPTTGWGQVNTVPTKPTGSGMYHYFTDGFTESGKPQKQKHIWYVSVSGELVLYISKYRSTTETITSVSNVTQMLVKNNIFYYSSGGVHTFDLVTKKNSGTIFTNKPVKKFAFDSNGNIWFSDNSGFIEKYNVTTKTFSNRIKIPYGIKDLKIDNSDRVWVGTNSGVYMFDSDSNPTVDAPTGVITGVSEQALLESQLSIYPNPNNGTFTIATMDAGTTVTLTDAIGVTETHKLETFHNEINTLLKGLVIVNIKSENGTVTKKMVIQ